MINKELIEDCIYNNPLALLVFKDKESRDYIDSFLPYSTGFEVECNRLPVYSVQDFKNIPNILNTNDYEENEQRFRIPSGLAGILCVYNITVQLKRNCSLNMGSGIHYHVDMTECFGLMNNDSFIKKNNNWIIQDLIKWETAKKIDENAKCSTSRAWVRYADEHRTLEVRIGEMSFEYDVIIKRIIDCNRIVKQLKVILSGESSVNSFLKTYKYKHEIDIHKLLTYIKTADVSGLEKQYELAKGEFKSKLAELVKMQKEGYDSNEMQSMKTVIQSRVKKFV